MIFLNGKCAYRIFKEEKLIIKYYSGEVGLAENIAFMKTLVADEEFAADYDIISDLRECNIVAKIEELPEYINCLENELKLRTGKRIAFLTMKPNEVVLSTLFLHEAGGMFKSANIFTTVEAMVKWLPRTDLSVDKINIMLTVVKTEFENQLS